MDLFKASSIITDEYSGKILCATHESPKSIKEISNVLGIPIAVCYRRIRTLEKLGFLVNEGVLHNEKGKDAKLYKSILNGMNISLMGEKLYVKINFTSGMSMNFVAKEPSSSPKERQPGSPINERYPGISKKEPEPVISKNE
jgi:DNA-binding Lrp family transcriptional regulator